MLEWPQIEIDFLRVNSNKFLILGLKTYRPVHPCSKQTEFSIRGLIEAAD